MRRVGDCLIQSSLPLRPAWSACQSTLTPDARSSSSPTMTRAAGRTRGLGLQTVYVTVTLAVAEFPRESCTRTTSVTLRVAPAV